MPGSLLYLLVEGIHKPLVPHEIAGHVHVSIVEQDPVFLEQGRGKGGTWNKPKSQPSPGPSPSPQGHKLNSMDQEMLVFCFYSTLQNASPMKVDTTMNPILQMGKPSLRICEKLAQGYTASEGTCTQAI